jgi:UDP-N-acetylmuramyl tripeptide synthase
MQPVGTGRADLPAVVVDYAHTPDALEQALQALRPLAQARGGRLWCVFGCGGNRDATKRPLMGAIAHRSADHVVLTSDNPRDEAASLILSQILAGIPDGDAIDVIEDRRDSIHEAVQRAAARDVVLIAGKGHEETQEVAGIKRAFSDVAVAAHALAQRAGAPGASKP